MRFLLLFTLCIPLLAWSHGGGTDANGCHTNRKTGEQHCHEKGAKRPATGSYSSRSSSSYSTSNSTALGYTRADFNFRSYGSSGNIGYYTGERCADIDIDHVVSLKDAYLSGASGWSSMEKEKFANDRENHVEACASVNRSKSDSIPRDFLRKSRDGKGRDYNIVNWCPYVVKYHRVKTKYNLSAASNDKQLLVNCHGTVRAEAAKQAVNEFANASTADGGEAMEWAKSKCELIGFGKDNPKHFNCIVNLMELR